MSEKSKAKARALNAVETANATVQKVQKMAENMQQTIPSPPPDLWANLSAARNNAKMSLTQAIGGARLSLNETNRFFMTLETVFGEANLKAVDDEAKRFVMLICQPPGAPYGETDTTTQQRNNELLFAGINERGLNAMPGQSKFLFKGTAVPLEMQKKMTLTDIHITKARGFAYYIGNLKHGQMIVEFLVETFGMPTQIPANYSPDWLAKHYPNPDMDPKVFIVPENEGMTIEPKPPLSRGQKTFVLIPDAGRRGLDYMHCLLAKEGFEMKKVTFPGDEPTALWTLVASDHSKISEHLSNIGIAFNIAEMPTPPAGGMGSASSSIAELS